MSAEVEPAVQNPRVDEDDFQNDLNGENSGDDGDLFGDDDEEADQQNEYGPLLTTAEALF